MTQGKLLRVLILIVVCLLVICIVAAVVFFAAGTSRTPTESGDETHTQQESETDRVTETDAESETDSIPASVILGETPDMGLSYQDKLVFFGESTTAHLKSRGVLTGGKETLQVWHPYSNTLQIQYALTTKLRYLGSDTTEDTVGNIAKEVKPEYLVLCFGLNGVEKFSSGEAGKKLFVSSYQALIDEIHKNSPDTKIILQSIYPVAEGCDDFKVDAKTINGYLTAINGWTMQLAAENGLKYVDAASAVTDENGYLMSAYDTGDGVHITAEGYKQVLAYFRTHAYVD